MHRRKSSVVCRNTASLYPLRLCDRTIRNTQVPRRCPAAFTSHAPRPKSTCASMPGALCIRRTGSSLCSESLAARRRTL